MFPEGRADWHVEKKHWANAEQIQGTSTSYSICKNRGPSKTRCSFLEGPFTWLENGENIPFLLLLCGIRKHHPYPFFSDLIRKLVILGWENTSPKHRIFSFEWPFFVFLSDRKLWCCWGSHGFSKLSGHSRWEGSRRLTWQWKKNNWKCIPYILLSKIWKHGDFPSSC